MSDKIKILYAEDEPFLAKIVLDQLAHSGYSVTHVVDGQKALTAYKKDKFDLAILDVMMPHTNGFEVGKEITEKQPTLPIIYLTAKIQTDDVLEGFASGGNDYIKKPFSIDELIARIDNLIELKGQRKRQKQKLEWSLGDFIYYPKLMRLDRQEVKITLSHRENELLKMLCLANNQPVNRKDILNELWGSDSYFNSRNLDVYIRKLRKHLSSELKVNIITLKGVGYRLVVE